MRLLVSVTNPGEVRAALSGGADIVDIKDPAQGPLGRPSAGVVRAVRSAVSAPHLVSVALGDATASADTLAPAAREAATEQVDFVKVGLVGAPDAESLLRSLVEMTAEANPDTRVVAVAYADTRQTNAVSPLSLPALAAAAGAHGVMLDTEHKNGMSLLAHLQEPLLSEFITLARSAGLFVALAGALGVLEIERLRELEPDVVGVRGAACKNGRGGNVDVALVRRLSQIVRRGPAVSGVSVSHSSPGGSALRK